MEEFKDSPTQLVGDVDCTAEGKAICDASGVCGFPNLERGDPSDLQDYQGGRDFKSIQKFAEDNLKPVCGPNNIDDKKKEIEEFMAMSLEDLQAKIDVEEKKLEEAEENFKSEVEKLQNAYQKTPG